ncbi:heterokaryon incompatibility protein-domain-containing protein [Dichomitus squalens]|uniref:Heterokaryon incompatibility protein-domain-containing protein n=1 Tax=Dichomitus squalens TaxID=114155 RepID=A0A4Q9MRH8_9APHY|nr:heterokaryon incompatibility protein-domain-containing protein [Dichomitus squalens]
MWLLSTGRAKLHEFVSPESVPGGYAILSHVWDKEEQSFQELRRLARECAVTGANPRDLASPKIRRCCQLAERHGYQWLWADTCCIDKTSSAELSEAINSMFRYYSLADVCYAYLRDVPRDDFLHNVDSAFRRSKWHSRGWTLQELLAPKFLIFLSQEWVPLGSKADLAPLVEEITGIPCAVLTFGMSMEQISVARRMSWAAVRETTRPEDEAYCLMGIFGISMSTLYGEGRRAFGRLQEEIMKHTPDTSLFGWGPCIAPYSQEWTTLGLSQPVSDSSLDHLHHHDMHLLATSPATFRDCDMSFTSPSIRSSHKAESDVVTQRSVGGLTSSFAFTLTAHGIFARIPLVERNGYAVAVLGLSCQETRLGLLLKQCPLSIDREYPLYDIGITLMFGIHYRLVPLGHVAGDIRLSGEPVNPQWRQVYLATRLPHATASTIPPRVLISFGLRAPFRFLQRHLQEIYNRLNLIVESAEPDHLPWTGSSPMRITFAFDHRKGGCATGHSRSKVILQLGRCTSSAYSLESSQRQARGLGPHWANVRFGMDPQVIAMLSSMDVTRSRWDYEPDPVASSDFPEHACPADHICEWQDRTRTFIDGTRMSPSMPSRTLDLSITLSFVPCPINPTNTFIVNMSGSWPDDLTNASVVWAPPTPRNTPPSDDLGSGDSFADRSAGLIQVSRSLTL